MIEGDAAPRAERTIALWNPPLTDPELGLRASSLGEASRLLAGLHAARPAHDLLREEPEGGRADPPLHGRAGGRGDREAARALPRRLHARAAARDRGAADGRRAARRDRDRRARARDRHRRARLRDLGRRSPARSPRCASSGAARAGAATASPSSSRARTRSTSSSCAIPRRCSPAPSRRRSSTTRTRACWTAHVLVGRVRGADRRGGRRRRSGPRRSRGRPCCPSSKHTGAGWIWAGTDYPAARVGLRSGEPESFTVVDRETGSVLGLVERSRAYSTVHEGAVYLHLGEQHLVRALDLEARTALVSSGRGRLVHAGEEGDADGDRGAAARRAAARARALLRPRLGDRAGRRLPAQVDQRRRHARDRAARPAGDELRDRGGLVLRRRRGSSRASRRCRSCSRRCTRPSTR